jgi:cell cycle sensor histidine kinase DivJ
VKRLPTGSDATLAKIRERRSEGDGRSAGCFRAVVEGAADLMTCHSPNGEVVYASPAAAEVAGLDAEGLMGQGLVRRVHVADLPAYLKSLSDAFNGATARAVEFRFRHGDEQRFVTMEMRCRPIRNAEGKTAAVVAVTRDVSDRRTLERELRAAREAAERANIAKTHFLAHMSHELRTPLNAIIGFAEMLQSDAMTLLQPERRREYASLIHTSGQHLLDVVNGILDMSKIESGLRDIAVEPLAIAPLVDTCCDMVRGQAREAGVGLLREVPADLPELNADRRAVKQILINLLSNGVKFTNPGGTVRVSAEADGGAMRIVVRDTGIGIAAEDLPRLGTPFMQADTGYERRYEGTGLGLSMVKGLAALHGGEMRIESVLGSGTAVTVTLPLEPAAAQPVVPRGEMKEFKRAG